MLKKWKLHIIHYIYVASYKHGFESFINLQGFTYIYRPQQSALFILQFLAIANSFLLVKLYINQLSTLISLLNYKILLTTTKKPSQKAIHRSKNTICPLRLNSANHGSCMQLRIRAKFSWFAS